MAFVLAIQVRILFAGAENSPMTRSAGKCLDTICNNNSGLNGRHVDSPVSTGQVQGGLAEWFIALLL